MPAEARFFDFDDGVHISGSEAADLQQRAHRYLQAAGMRCCGTIFMMSGRQYYFGLDRPFRTNSY
jgi:hypothetical protein